MQIVTFRLRGGSGGVAGPGTRGQVNRPVLRQAHPMTTPEPEDPQPRNIALELETPELAADLEAQSDPAADQPGDES
jgi:hypothetical protein